MRESVLKCLSEVTGLKEVEFEDYSDINLLSEGIIDSLSLITFFSKLSKLTGKEMTVSDFAKRDFNSIDDLVKKVEAVCKSK